jgi:hypothetical protein
MTKVIARYTFNVLWPARQGFFDGYGHRMRDSKEMYERYCSANITFWTSLALCVSVFAAGMLIHPFGTMWFFTFIVLHSQFNLMGQFFAIRYLYLSMIGLCVVVGTLLQPYPVLMAIVATYLCYKTSQFIPAWRDQSALWRHDIIAYPDYSQTWNSYAQHIMACNDVAKEKAKPWQMNELGYVVMKAQELEPDSWEVQMNMAAFMASLGHLDTCLTHTNKALELLEKAGGKRHPYQMLIQQKSNVEKVIADVKQKAEQGALGSSLSRPPVENGSTSQEAGRENGQRTTEGTEVTDILESVGTERT